MLSGCTDRLLKNAEKFRHGDARHYLVGRAR